MNIHEIRKALQEIIEKIDAPELKELGVQDMANSIIENHPNPRSKQFALGVLSFYESGMALINKKHL